MIETGYSITPLHTNVPGRARLRIPGLYKCPALKRFLENRLPDGSTILSTSASVLTGTVLVRFTPSLELSVLLSKVEILVLERHLPQETLTVEPSGVPWHQLEESEVVALLESSPVTGLSSSEAAERLRRNGPNLLPTPPLQGSFAAFLEQFNSPPVLLLLGSAVLSVATGGVGDAVAILAVVAVNAIVGFFTERQAQSRIAALLSNERLTGAVCRDGCSLDIGAEQLVVGDLLIVRRGSHVVGDARVLDAHDLRIDESALTGESLSVQKRACRLTDPDAPITDRVNMLYRGTLVTGGEATAIVVAVGGETEIGKLQRLVLESTTPETPLQRQLRELGVQQVQMASVICGAVFFAGLLRGYSLLEMFKTAVSLAVASIPEGLPAIATTSLASGLNALLRCDILVRRLSAIETLGAVQVACLDKTGTLTMNRMSVTAVFAGMQSFDVIDGRIADGEASAEHPDLRRLLQVCVLCAEISVDDEAAPLLRSPTEAALLEMAVASGVDSRALAEAYPLRLRRTRTDELSYMATWHASAAGTFIAIKGSPSEVLDLCTSHLQDGEVRSLADDTRAAIRSQNAAFAAAAMRVLGIAYVDVDHEIDTFGDSVVWVGLVGMADPMRPGMSHLLGELRRAGIKPVMITGDQPATAQAIGRDLEMHNHRELTASELMDSEPGDEAIVTITTQADVFSRVSPSGKLKIVRAYQQSGLVVAMTGDGINDAPALKAADVGITLGQAGTEIAQDVADVVLVNDDITSLIAAIREGRRVGDNVRCAVDYITATNLSEIALVFSSIAVGLGQPLNTRQLLWINLLSDIFPELAFAIEAARDGLLDRQPRNVNARVIGPDDYRRLAAQSGLISASALGAYAFGIGRYGIGIRSSTMGFVALTSAQLLHALSVLRSAAADTATKPASGSWVPAATGVGLLVMVASQIVPGIGGALGTVPLGFGDVLICGGAAAASFAANEILKTCRQDSGSPVNLEEPLCAPI